MSSFNMYLLGIVSGIYITQNYNVPKIKTYIDYLYSYVKKLEKENRKDIE